MPLDEVPEVDEETGDREAFIRRFDEVKTFFGELALLDDSPRSASAIASKTTETFAFFRTDLDRLLTAFPQIGLKVYRSLAMIIGSRLRDTNEQLLNR